MKWTGVGATFCASHNSPEGELHGHSYEVKAWFRRGGDALARQNELQRVLEQFDHQHLEHELAWGEEIAEAIGLALGGDCMSVEVNRPLERLYAEWRRD